MPAVLSPAAPALVGIIGGIIVAKWFMPSVATVDRQGIVDMGGYWDVPGPVFGPGVWYFNNERYPYQLKPWFRDKLWKNSEDPQAWWTEHGPEDAYGNVWWEERIEVPGNTTTVPKKKVKTWTISPPEVTPRRYNRPGIDPTPGWNSPGVRSNPNPGRPGPGRKPGPGRRTKNDVIEITVTPNGIVTVRRTQPSGRPPAGVKESKARSKIAQVLAIALDLGSEGYEVWEILKENAGIPKFKTEREAMEMLMDGAFWNIDRAQLAIDLSRNVIEDKIYGKFFGAVDKSFKALDQSTTTIYGA